VDDDKIDDRIGEVGNIYVKNNQLNSEGLPNESDCPHKIWAPRGSSAQRGTETYSQG
jgi:hypothetical protein